ncbi:hypothetical protein PR202_ga19624 [Eleusine coracana subsp. coracana]|uniref:Sphingolipid transporter spinster-like protein n=1 Tax=Eleusine coracana subsp. coracana TaxID=191504 RepID=A0AAV5CWW1_ELECO|nr:hypothetical protein PR202_ga19624 [Eleusine coracana subsp. coracana]
MGPGVGSRLLVMFCIINMLNYVDRGAIASNGVNGSQKSCSGGTCTSGSGIQGDFNLNNFEDGVLSSAFMVGLLVASPIFASLAKMLVGNSLHWRAAFWGESILMVPFVILGFVIKPLDLKGFAHNTTKEYGPMRNPEVQDETRYISYNFVIGAYSYWGPKAGQDIYNMASADLMFGGITIVCGIFGTLAGGFILDKIESTISNAFKLLSGATFLGQYAVFGAFCFKSLYGFIPFFSVGELLVFATQAPVNYICLHCVKPSLRPLSMAMSTVSIHIFGDVPSSPLVGLLSGIFVRSVDRFNEQSEHGLPAAERSNLRPLLDQNDEARASE